MNQVSASPGPGKALRLTLSGLLVLAAARPVAAEESCPWVTWLAEVHGATRPWRYQAVPLTESLQSPGGEPNGTPDAIGAWWRLPALQGRGRTGTRL